MKKCIVSLALAIILLSTFGERRAYAYYDDVHYALTYVVARHLGYTPLQAYRIASACVSVDYAPETEPVQGSNLAGTLLRALGAGALKSGDPTFPIVALFRVVDNIETTQGSPEAKAVALAADAHWRFHAFRNLYRYNQSFGNGAQAAIADAAIQEQQDVLWEEAVRMRNPGIFLHFFQDRVPHGRYVSGGGHWVCPPDAIAIGMPIGSTTDWLSFRNVGSNTNLVNDTAKYLTSFLSAAAEAENKPRQHLHAIDSANLAKLVAGLRLVNKYPPGIVGDSTGDIINKVIAAKVSDPKHSHGPSLDDALPIADAALERKEMIEKAVPPKPAMFGIRKSSESSGAYFSDPDATTLWGTLNVSINAGSASGSPLVVTILAPPTAKGEEQYQLDKDIEANPSADILSGGTSIPFHDMPVGDVIVRVRLGDQEVEKRVRLTKQVNETTVDLGSAGSYRCDKPDVKMPGAGGYKNIEGGFSGITLKYYDESVNVTFSGIRTSMSPGDKVTISLSAPANCTASLTVRCAKRFIPPLTGNPVVEGGKTKSWTFEFGIDPDYEPSISVTASWNGIGGSARFVYRKVDK